MGNFYFAGIKEDFINNQDSIEQFLIQEKNSSKRYKYNSGGYRLENNRIIIQIFAPMPSQKWDLFNFTGTILDKNLAIESCILRKRKDYCTDNFNLNFIIVSKPDSIEQNRWSNKNWYWTN